MAVNFVSHELSSPEESIQAPCIPSPPTLMPLQNSNLPENAVRPPADQNVVINDSMNNNLQRADLNEASANQPQDNSIPSNSRKSWVRVFPSNPFSPDSESSRPISTLQNSNTSLAPLERSTKPFAPTHAHTSAQNYIVPTTTSENAVQASIDLSSNQTVDNANPPRSRVLNMAVNLFSSELSSSVESCQPFGMPSHPTCTRLQNSKILSFLPENASRPRSDHINGDKPVLKRYSYANSSLTPEANKSLHSIDLNETSVSQPHEISIPSNSRKSWVRVFPSDPSSPDEVSSRSPSTLQNSNISPAPAKTSTKPFDATNAHTSAQSSSVPTATPENAVQTHTDLSANQTSDKPTPSRSKVLNMVANIFSQDLYTPGEASKLPSSRPLPSTLQNSKTFQAPVEKSTKPFVSTPAHTSAQSSIVQTTTPENAVQASTDLSANQTVDSSIPSRSRVLNMAMNLFSSELSSSVESSQPFGMASPLTPTRLQKSKILSFLPENSNISETPAETSTKPFDATNSHTSAQSSGVPTATPENAVQTTTDLSANQTSDKPPPSRSKVLKMVANIFSPDLYAPGDALQLPPNRSFPSTLQNSNTFQAPVTTSTKPFAPALAHSSAQSSIVPTTTPENAGQTPTDLSANQTSDKPTPSRSRVLNMVANLFLADLNSQMESGRPHTVSNNTVQRRYPYSNSSLRHGSCLSPQPPPKQQQACNVPGNNGPRYVMPTTMDPTVSVSSLHEIQTPEYMYMYSSDIVGEDSDQPVNQNAMEKGELKEQNTAEERKVVPCQVCMQAPVSHFVLPCGQIEACLECAGCRLIIRERVRAYLDSHHH